MRLGIFWKLKFLNLNAFQLVRFGSGEFTHLLFTSIELFSHAQKIPAQASLVGKAFIVFGLHVRQDMLVVITTSRVVVARAASTGMRSASSVRRVSLSSFTVAPRVFLLRAVLVRIVRSKRDIVLIILLVPFLLFFLFGTFFWWGVVSRRTASVAWTTRGTAARLSIIAPIVTTLPLTTTVVAWGRTACALARAGVIAAWGLSAVGRTASTPATSR
jgi:hypothetical protein